MDVKNDVVDKVDAIELQKSLGNIRFENVVF
jgi:hypothetical protein